MSPRESLLLCPLLLRQNRPSPLPNPPRGSPLFHPLPQFPLTQQLPFIPHAGLSSVHLIVRTLKGWALIGSWHEGGEGAGSGRGNPPLGRSSRKMDPGRNEPPGERASRRPVVDNGLSPELRVEKYPEKGKLLGPALSRIRSELALPLELPQDLPPGYLCRQRRSLPARPPLPGPPLPPELRASSDVLCAGHFPAGLSRLVTGMRTPAPGSPPMRRGSPPVPGGGGNGEVRGGPPRCGSLRK